MSSLQQNNGPVRLYVSEAYREPKLFTHIELLFPFWGITSKEATPYVRAASLQHTYQKKDFELVSDIKDAEYVVMPYQYDRLMAANPDRVEFILRQAREAGKLVLIDGSGDIEHPIPVPNSVILRVSQYQYSKKENEVTVPFPAEDLLTSYAKGTLVLRTKQEKPSVGFTGWAVLSLRRRVLTFLKEVPTYLRALVDAKRGAEHRGVLFRARALAALTKTRSIETHFTARRSYSGHVKTIAGTVEENRRTFVENLLECDYALCVRGDANSSVRFYEALSLGRIPLFLDTACVLPLEDELHYRDFCVFVDWRDTDRIGEKLATFHTTCSPERFKAMQEAARNAFQNYLRMDAFSGRLATELRKRSQAFYTRTSS